MKQFEFLVDQTKVVVNYEATFYRMVRVEFVTPIAGFKIDFLAPDIIEICNNNIRVRESVEEQLRKPKVYEVIDNINLFDDEQAQPFIKSEVQKLFKKIANVQRHRSLYQEVLDSYNHCLSVCKMAMCNVKYDCLRHEIRANHRVECFIRNRILDTLKSTIEGINEDNKEDFLFDFRLLADILKIHEEDKTHQTN